MLLVGIIFALAGCVDKPQPEEAPPNNPAPMTKENGSNPFHDRLLQIAGEYESYERADGQFRWAPLPCASPSIAVVGPPAEVPKQSASGDSTTHGRKLYFMFARQVWDPPSPGYIGVSYITFPGKTAPVGQAIVKQSWVPEEVTPAAPRQDVKSAGKPPRGEVVRDGKTYRAARQGELFIMYKLDPKTPGTDNGWVYGVVSADAKTVLNAGRIDNCMKCHVDAPHDRLFGLPEEHTPPRK
jgi:hypothetical protein